jgi:hypothetical protein
VALVTKLEPLVIDRDVAHKEVRCTYSIFSDADGRRYLQLDTYGSKSRQMRNKKSQSLKIRTGGVGRTHCNY